MELHTGFITIVRILLIISFLIFSCGKEDEPMQPDSLSLEYVGFVSFPLDSLSGKYHFALQAFHDTSGNAYFSFFNRNNSVLYIYDYDKREITEQIPFEQEGPNGIGNPGKIGYLVVSLDTIFLYEAYSFKLFQSDRKGKIVNTFLVRSADAGIYSSYPDVRTLKPLFFQDDKIYLTGLKVGIEPIPDHTKLDNVLIVDLQKKAVEASPFIKRSEQYNKGQWGALLKYQLFGCFNEESKKFVYSFGLDHHIYETDHATYENRYFMQSRFFDKKIKPLAKNKDVTPIELSVAERTLYDFTTPSYYTILHDPYRKLYYRFVTPPLSEEEYKDNKTFSPSVIILDEDFKIQGETRLPPQGVNDYSMMFINEAGLHIMHDNREENTLVFAIFQPKETK